MPVDQPKFGEIYDARRAAASPTTRTCRPSSSIPANPLHRILSSARRDLAELANLDDANPAVHGLPRRRVPAVDRPGRELHSASTRSATCRIAFWTRVHASASARGTRASSCSARASTTTRRRSPTHMLPGERRRQRARLPAEAGAMAEVFEKPGSDYARMQRGAAPRRRRLSRIPTS